MTKLMVIMMIFIVILGLWLFFALRYMKRNKGCDGDCGHCPARKNRSDFCDSREKSGKTFGQE